MKSGKWQENPSLKCTGSYEGGNQEKISIMLSTEGNNGNQISDMIGEKVLICSLSNLLKLSIQIRTEKEGDLTKYLLRLAPGLEPGRQRHKHRPCPPHKPPQPALPDVCW